MSCRGHIRHWFTVYGSPGLRTPVCVRGCGTPNPRPLTEDEWRDLAQYRRLVGRLDAQTEAAIAAEQERRRTAARKMRDILTEIAEQRA